MEKKKKKRKEKKRKGDAGRRDSGRFSALRRFSYRQGPPLTELAVAPFSHPPSSSCGLLWLPGRVQATLRCGANPLRCHIEAPLGS
jgi:hypothetical protein